jgi:hypothetical protein
MSTTDSQLHPPQLVQVYDILTDLNESSLFVDSAQFRRRRWSLAVILVTSVGLACASSLVFALATASAGEDLRSHLVWYLPAAGSALIAGGLGAYIFSNRILVPFVTVPFELLGVALTGKITGLRMCFFTLGPWAFTRQSEALEVVRHGSIQLSNGGIYVFDTHEREPSHDDAAFVHSGTAVGSTLNVLVVAPLLLGALTLVVYGPRPLALAGLLLGYMAILSIMVALVATVKTLRVTRALHRDDRLARAWSAQHHIASLLLSGTRPRELPSQPILDLWAVAHGPGGSPSDRRLVNHFQYLRAVDAGEINEAGAYLRTAIEEFESTPDKQRKEILTRSVVGIYDEAAYFSSVYESDAVAGSRWLYLADRFTLNGRRERVVSEAAVLYRRGDTDEARRRVVHGLELSKLYGEPETADYVTDRLRSLLSIINEGQPNRTVADLPPNVASS